MVLTQNESQEHHQNHLTMDVRKRGQRGPLVSKIALGGVAKRCV
jgi:hypothetical protein